MSNTKLAAAVAAAVPAAQADMENADDAKTPEGTAAQTPEATDDKAKSNSGTSTEVSSDVETKDVPDTLFGVDLSVLPDDETRAKFVAEFQETNKTINKLQREVAEAKVEPPAPQAPAPEVEQQVDVSKLTDEQIAQALGLDPENMDERDVRDIALTRSLLEQQAKLDKLETSYSETARAATWGRALEELERDFGALPEGMTREDVMGWAKTQGIPDPKAAYWAAVGPVRATVTAALQQRMVELRSTDKRSATTPRPQGSQGVEETLKATTVKDAVGEAFRRAQKELGIGDKE